MAAPCHTSARKRAAGKRKKGASTQTSRFVPSADTGSADLGYSDSVVQGVVLAR